MLFNSFPFAGLVLLTAVVYYLPPLRRLQPITLIAASFYFYASNSPALLLVLAACIGTNILLSHGIALSGGPGRGALAAVGVAANLAILSFFKYSSLAGHTFFNGEGPVGAFLLTIPLPVGISFYTFQGITLIVDTLKAGQGRLEPLHAGETLTGRAVKVAHYLSFFPQLVAGPIVKAHDFVPQIKPKRPGDVDWKFAFKHIVAGYFFKMVVADNLREFTSWIEYPFFLNKSTADLLAVLFGYSMQIYADFAGYSLIAIGIAALFGYRLPENFNAPYIARSFSEFWRRWHISLSSFLKEYLYFPLGGNRKGAARTYVNIMIVMLLGGLWHGAAWSYMVWGGAHGCALAVERLLRRKVPLPENTAVTVMQTLFVFSFVSFAWLLFKLPDFSHVVAYVRAIGDNVGIRTHQDHLAGIVIFSLPVIIQHGWHLRRSAAPRPAPPAFEPLLYGLMLFFIATNSGSPEAFIYFQF